MAASHHSVASDLISRAIASHRAGNLHEAENMYKVLLASNPQHIHALTLLGTIYSQRGEYGEGIRLLDAAIAVKPDHAEAYFNRALSLQRIGQYRDALADYEKATHIDSTYVEAFWHKSLIHLTLGQYEEGWKLYEWRWKTRRPEEIRHFSQPMWNGESGKTILVHAEQGFGDSLQFCRYLPLVAKEGRVIFECPDSLVSLMQFNFPEVNVTSSCKDAAIECHIPLLSIPGVLGTTLDNILPTPYLKAEPQRIEKWSLRLNDIIAKSGESLRIGLCWAGGQRPGHPESLEVDSRRSLHFEQIKPLLDVKDAAFISLQVGPPKHQRNDDRVKDITSEIEDWSDTAAIVSQLDLVISVDTAVCHLAAAMGKRTFLLNRYDTCWRWLLNRNDSPWYPSLTQFRQKVPGDWADVIERVKAVMSQINIKDVTN